MEIAARHPEAPPSTVRMPAFAQSTHTHTHTLHSALICLQALGVGPHRIVLRRIGRDAKAAGTIVRQYPGPGTTLTGASIIHLDIAGLGFTHALPIGMWDSGGEAAAGTREILEPFDDPLEKLKHWFHEGAPLFRIAPEDPAACARWLSLFGVPPQDWPRPLWYRLASLVASLSHLSCSRQGCEFVLQVLLDLPVKSFHYRPAVTPLPAGALSSLGSRASRLGVDLLMGDAMEDQAILQIEIGPVPLSVFQHFQETEAGGDLLHRVLAMIVPLSSPCEVTWAVEDTSRPPRLGVAEQNSRLGINTHMGTSLPTAPHPLSPPPAAAQDTVSQHTDWSLQ